MNVLTITLFFPNPFQAWLTGGLSGLSQNNINNFVYAHTASADAKKLQNDDALQALCKDYRYFSGNHLRGALAQIIALFFSIKAFKFVYCCFRELPSLCRFCSIRRYLWRVIDRTQLSGLKLDLVHCHHIPSALRAYSIAQQFKLPLITTVHALVETGILGMSQADRDLIFTKSAHVLAGTSYVANQLMRLGCPAEKIKIMPQALNPARFPYRANKGVGSDERVEMFTAARLDKNKGLQDIISAIALLPSELQEQIHYNIVGHGPFKNSLVQQIASLGMQRYIEILPPAFGEAILPWFDKASIYCLPARINPQGGAETQAFSLQEAMSAGCLVISTNTGGIVEVTRNGELALLVEPNSPEQLAKAIIEMLAKREQWPEMRSNALQWVEQNYSLRVWSPKLADLYRETQVQWSASKGGLLRARK